MLLFNSAGYIIIYFQLKSYFKKEAFSKLENYIKQEELTTIILTKYEFENEDENFYFVEPNEIMFHGKMYDISRIEHDGNKVKIIALSDENETNLKDLFAQFFTRNLNDKYSKTASILHSLIGDAGLPFNYDGIFPLNSNLLNNKILYPILNIFIDIPYPPPKFIS
jgi:hypothetical protein